MTTFASNGCLGYNGVGSPGMKVCDGSNDQQLRLPGSWFPDITTATLKQVRLSSNNAMCMEVSESQGTVLFASCQDNNDSQVFSYDASTHQIKQQKGLGTVLCLTTNTDDGPDHSDHGSTDVSMESCMHSDKQVRLAPLVCVSVHAYITAQCPQTIVSVLALQSEHPPARYFSRRPSLLGMG